MRRCFHHRKRRVRRSDDCIANERHADRDFVLAGDVSGSPVGAHGDPAGVPAVVAAPCHLMVITDENRELECDDQQRIVFDRDRFDHGGEDVATLIRVDRSSNQVGAFCECQERVRVSRVVHWISPGVRERWARISTIEISILYHKIQTISIIGEKHVRRDGRIG